MRQINLDYLRALVEVVAQGSFSAAARKLNLSQPAVSLQIRELEARWGVQLIERVGKQALATAPGREMIERAHRIFRECDAAEESMRHFHEGWLGRVHIAATLTALIYELPPVLRELRSTYPEIDLVVTNMPTREAIERVIDNTVDLALVNLPVKSSRLNVTPLRPEKLVAIFPPQTQNVPDVVTPDYVARQALVLGHEQGAVHRLVMEWLDHEMPLAHAPMHVGIIEAAAQAVASGLGMSIVPDVAVAASSTDYIVRPLDPPVPCTLGLIEHRNKSTSRATDIVRQALLQLGRTGEAAAAPAKSLRVSNAGKQPLRPVGSRR